MGHGRRLRAADRAGVCSATPGPGAINLLLDTANAQTCSALLVALGAQVGLQRIYKESHQSIDLAALFRPVTKWLEVEAATADSEEFGT